MPVSLHVDMEAGSGASPHCGEEARHTASAAAVPPSPLGTELAVVCLRSGFQVWRLVASPGWGARQTWTGVLALFLPSV